MAPICTPLISEFGFACASAESSDSVRPSTSAAGTPASATLPNSLLVYAIPSPELFGCAALRILRAFQSGLKSIAGQLRTAGNLAKFAARRKHSARGRESADQ